MWNTALLKLFSGPLKEQQVTPVGSRPTAMIGVICQQYEWDIPAVE
jgi:hypothetical protein